MNDTIIIDGVIFLLLFSPDSSNLYPNHKNAILKSKTKNFGSQLGLSKIFTDSLTAVKILMCFK